MKTNQTETAMSYPTVEQLEKELKRERYRRNYNRALRSTLFTLVSVAAVAILIAMLLMPVLQIYGSSMSPCLEDGEIVVTVKRGDFQQGDVISFYYNNKILVKRIIAFPGDWVDLDADGNVFVNGQKLEEPYLDEAHTRRRTSMEPVMLGDDEYFVMGDNRDWSHDSRNYYDDKTPAAITRDMIKGHVQLVVFPFDNFRSID